MSGHEFACWLLRAKLGESLIYHTGELACDRELGRPCRVLAEAVWEAHNAGYVRLAQQRLTEGFHYLAIRTAESYSLGLEINSPASHI